MNLIRLELPDGITNSIDGYSVVRALNDRLPDDIVAWGARKVSSITSSRPIISRKYFYMRELIKNWHQDLHINLRE